MKIIFPKEGECLVCKKCKEPIKGSHCLEGEIDFYWCENCLDYADVMACSLVVKHRADNAGSGCSIQPRPTKNL